MRAKKEGGYHLAVVYLLAGTVNHAFLDEAEQAVSKHLRMQAKVFMVGQLRCQSVGKGTDAHLQAVSVFYQGCAVATNLHFRGRGLSKSGSYQGLIVLNQIVERLCAYEVSVSEGDVGINDAYYKVCGLDCRVRAVNRGAK